MTLHKLKFNIILVIVLGEQGSCFDIFNINQFWLWSRFVCLACFNCFTCWDL